jgi:hypothetical protein
LDDNCTHLPHLVGFGKRTVPLQIDSFFHALAAEYVMTAASAFIEPKLLEHAAQFIEGNIIIGSRFRCDQMGSA